jgi:CHASE3 domain sensor protein
MIGAVAMHARLILCTTLLIASALPAFGQSSGAASTQESNIEQQRKQKAEADAEAVRKEVEEAAQTIGDYTLARRDEALERVETAVDRVDRRMARLREDWDQRLKRMSATAKARNDRTMSDIKRRRDDLDAKYDALRRSSDAAWNDAKTGFVRSYRELAEAMRNARAEYERTPEPPADAPEEPEEKE